MRRSLKEVNRYPDASCFYLRKKVASSLGVDARCLIFGNGSDEIIGIAVRTFVGEADEVIIAKPTFLIYEIVSQIQNASIKSVPLSKDLRHDLKAMRDAVTPKTKIVFIANPDNPTGTYVTKRELDDFFEGLPGETIVFLDEAYFEFARFGCADYPDGTDYLDRPNVIVARSFSKAYGLAGLRVGYGISSPELIGYMERTREPFNVNLLAQAGAAAALDDKAFLKRTLKHVRTQQRLMCKALSSMAIRSVPSATNFLLLDLERYSAPIAERLLRKGVIVRDMKPWGLDTYIRVTIGTIQENKRFLAALKEVLR
jgi:histidinol-phosphate aminotransferase